jgi:hypothetical protein
MDVVTVEFTGTTPLLMHSDNIEWADQMEEWKNDPANKKLSKAGDDRTPPFRWIGCLYHDGNNVAMPSENIMRCIMDGAAQVPIGKGNKTFKATSQSGLVSLDPFFEFKTNGRLIPFSEIEAMMPLKTYKEHVDRAVQMGFSLFMKRARVGTAKHIRVRPRFDRWTCTGRMAITDPTITPKVLETILTISGQIKGLSDWRPGSRTPGSWGMFTVKLS